MIQGFLFNGINTETTGATVGGELDLSVQTLTYKAQSPLPLPKLAKTWTQVTLNPVVFEFMPEPGGLELPAWGIFSMSVGQDRRHVLSILTQVTRIGIMAQFTKIP